MTRLFTVASAMKSRSAICLLELPAAISLKTSISRGLNSSSVACSASSAATSGGILFRPAMTA